MKKRIVSIIINWLGLACIEARLNEMDYLEIIRMREQAKRIDAVDARLTVCEQKIDELLEFKSSVNAIEATNAVRLATIENTIKDIDDLVQGKIDDVIDEALDKIDLAAKAESAIEEAVDNATLSVRF